jgi:hypothetical protein
VPFRYCTCPYLHIYTCVYMYIFMYVCAFICVSVRFDVNGYLGLCCVLQVGSYFVGQYYQVLQQNPDLVHQFYSESSTMTRVDGESSDTASAMLVCIFVCMYMNVFMLYACACIM